jgi:hypothetical protein
MCEYSGRLIAWLDRELPDEEATNVEWHVGRCAECRRAVSAYEEVGSAFLDCYEMAMVEPPKRNYWRWAVAFGGVAAATLLLAALFSSRQAAQLPDYSPPAVHAPSVAFQRTPAFEKAPARIMAVRARRAPDPEPIRTPWVPFEPVVEVALPADALFPPGAVPEGFSFIADIRPQQ